MGWHDHPHAPPIGSVLCSLASIPQHGCKEISYGSGDSRFGLILFRRNDDIRAYVNCCPHFSVPLNAHPDEFLLLPDDRIMCAWHCSVFRLTDGACEQGPSTGLGLDAVQVSLVGGNVVIGRSGAPSLSVEGA